MRNLKKVLALVLVLALSLTMFAGAIETVLPYDDLDELTAERLTRSSSCMLSALSRATMRTVSIRQTRSLV